MVEIRRILSPNSNPPSSWEKKWWKLSKGLTTENQGSLGK
jgi:hypothetical protein